MFLYAQEEQQVYILNLGGESVSIIDSTTNTVTGTVSVSPANPRLGAVTPDNSQLYVSSANNSTLTVIDLATNTVIQTVSLSTNSGGGNVVFTPDGTKAYVQSVNSEFVDVINTSTLEVITAISTAGGSNVSSAVITPDGSQLYAFGSADNVAYVIDTETDSVTTTFSIGGGTSSFAATITSSGRFIYVSGEGNNTVRLIDTTDNSVTTPINVAGSGFAGIQLTPDDSQLYIVDAFGRILVYRTSDNTEIDDITIGGSPQLIGITPDGTTGYVTNFNTDSVNVLNLATNQITTTISVGTSPIGIAIANLSPPFEFSGKQLINDFGVASELFNKLTWKQLSSNTISGYRLERNGVTIATLDAFARSFEDHNRPPDTADVYTLTAFHDSGSESSSVTIVVGG